MLDLLQKSPSSIAEQVVQKGPSNKAAGPLAGGAYAAVREHDKGPRTQLADFFNNLLETEEPMSQQTRSTSTDSQLLGIRQRDEVRSTRHRRHFIDRFHIDQDPPTQTDKPIWIKLGFQSLQPMTDGVAFFFDGSDMHQFALGDN